MAILSRAHLDSSGIKRAVPWFVAIVIAIPTATAMQANALALPSAVAFIVLWITWQDLRSFTIPDAALAALAVLATLAQTQAPWFAIEPAISIGLFAAEGLVCGGSILIVREVYFRRFGHEGIGFGDVKLAAVGGLLCGLSGFSLALLSSSLVGILVALAARRFRPDRFDGKIPFGAILSPALLLVWLLGVGL
jgi:prepilin signal peptidase PulO-like enzyme (type II secretory pathway)